MRRTEEGIDISMNLIKHGFVADEEIERFPGVTHRVGVHPVMECTQNIPCNPCQDACPKHCIKIGEHITSLPAVDEAADCIGCGMCVASCSGQAIFLVDETYEPGFATVTFHMNSFHFRNREKRDMGWAEMVRRSVRQK